MIHIGISGGIAAGKSTLAKKLRAIAESQGYATAILPFAESVRQVAALESSGMRVLQLDLLFSSWGFDPMKAKLAAIATDQAMIEYPSLTGIKNRRLLQIIGNEIGRDMLNEDVWIYRVQEKIKTIPMLDFVISDDLRYDNEAMAVDVHVAVVDNECSETRRAAFGTSYTYSNHASEHSLSLNPLLYIQACFSDDEVMNLFTVLNKIRILRY